MGGIADLVDDIVSFVGRPFGIYTHDETFVDLNVSRLLTPGEADNAARNSAIRNSGGDANMYFSVYRNFQRQYKRRYSQKFLESIGYAPSTNAKTTVIDESLLVSHLQTVLGYSTVVLEKGIDTYLTLDQRANYGRQFVTNYDVPTLSVTIGGLVYTYREAEEVSSTEIKLRFVRNYTDSIIDNLASNYSYNSLNDTVIINGEIYDVGIIDPTINTNDKYETICTHQGSTLPDETILTSVERYDENYVNTLFEQECTYSEYRVTSGEVDTSLRYYIEPADTALIYVVANINATAVIPMKENNVIANNNNELKRVLKKLNLSHDQLIESLENPDIDAAYLITGLDLFKDDDVHNKVMFQTFDLMSPGSGNSTIRISQLKTVYSFSIEKSTKLGSVAAVGKYIRLNRNSGGITLRYQGSLTEYQEIVISNFTQVYTISGQVITNDFDSGNSRLVIPLDIMNSLRYREWVEIYENSLCFVAYAIEVVEVKWYETAAFGFILQVIGFVLVLSGIDPGGSFLALVESVVINYAISELVMFLAEAIGGEFGALIAGIVAIVIGLEMGTFGDSTGSELWLRAADKGLSTINQIVSSMTEEKLNEFRSELDELDRQIKEITDKLEEQEEDSTIFATSTLPFGSIGAPNSVFQTTEQYVNSIVNTEWLVDGHWLYDIDGEIRRRNSVYVG